MLTFFGCSASLAATQITKQEEAPVRVIVVFGQNRAGKGTVVGLLERLLVGVYDVFVQRFSDPLTDELDRRGVPRSRPNYAALTREAFDRFGWDVLARILHRRTLARKPEVAIYDGMRMPAQLAYLRHHSQPFLVYVTAPAEVRYERARQASEKADENGLSWETFQGQDRAWNEVFVPELGRQADVTIENIHDLAALVRQVERTVRQAFPPSPNLPATPWLRLGVLADRLEDWFRFGEFLGRSARAGEASCLFRHPYDVYQRWADEALLLDRLPFGLSPEAEREVIDRVVAGEATWRTEPILAIELARLADWTALQHQRGARLLYLPHPELTIGADPARHPVIKGLALASPTGVQRLHAQTADAVVRMDHDRQALETVIRHLLVPKFAVSAAPPR